MHLGSDYDENGPMTLLGDVVFSAETGLPGGPQEFKLPVFMVSTEESQVIVEYNGFRLTDFGTRNDWYGFGTSPQSALRDARSSIESLEGCNADIMVVTTLRTRPCFPADSEPFYNGSQRVHYIPPRWRTAADQIKDTAREYVVWQNGERTPQALDFYDEVIRLAKADQAPARKGDLLTVATRKDSTGRDGFMRTATELSQ